MSPVTMRTIMPARWQMRTASTTSFRRGSYIGTETRGHSTDMRDTAQREGHRREGGKANQRGRTQDETGEADGGKAGRRWFGLDVCGVP